MVTPLNEINIMYYLIVSDEVTIKLRNNNFYSSLFICMSTGLR